MEGRTAKVIGLSSHLSRRRVIGSTFGLLLPVALSGCSLAKKQQRVEQRLYYSAESIFANGLTPQLLFEVPNDRLEQTVIDYMIDSMTSDYWDWYDEFPKLSAGYRAIYSTMDLEGEVDNGGLSQYFFNSSGYLAYDALDGCRLIGALETAAVLEDAIALEKEVGTWGSKFPDSGAPGRDYDGLYEYADYEEYDERFYDSPDDLSALRIRYIRDHPWEFTGPPIPE